MPNSVDARSDLYAVGAVGCFLLTGQPVFEADSVVDLCQKHIVTPPVPPSERINIPIPAELERTLLACLEKIASQTSSNCPRRGDTHVALRRGHAVVGRRCRRLVGPARTWTAK